MSWFRRLFHSSAWRSAWDLEQRGRHAEARAIYERIGDEGSGELKTASLVRAGMIATGAGDLMKARQLFQRATAASPADATAWLHYANACFRLLDTGSADDAYHEALKHAPGRPDILYYQAVYYGDRMAKAGLQAARRAGLALFDLLDRPDGPGLIDELGFNRQLPGIFIRNFSLEKQLSDDGLAILREFADRPAGPGTAWVRPAMLNHLGLLLTNVGRYDDALAEFGATLEAKPDFIEARFNRGMTQVRRHDFDEARRDFAEYAKKFPTSPVTSFATALMAETKGDLREAERLYRFFLERVERTPVPPSALGLLDVARTWVEHARTWIEAANRPSEGGSTEKDPGVDGDTSDRPRGT